MRRVVLLSLVWGWSFLLIKVALGGMTPATVAFGRLALGTVVMLFVLRALGAALPRDLGTWRHFAVMGLAYGALPFTLLAWGEQHITSALTAVVNASTGLFTAMAAAIGLGERLSRRQLVGLAMGFTGVAVAAGVSGGDLGSSSVTGIAAALAASACYGFSFVYARRHLATTPPLVAACGQLLTGTALCAPLAVATSAADGFSPNARQLVAVTALGVLGTGFAYVVIYQSIADIGPTRSSLVTYLVPIVAVTLGVVFLDEPFSGRLLVGGALTIAGIALVQDRFRRVRPGRVVAGVVALFVMGGCGGDNGGGASGGGACGRAVEEPLDPRSTQHLLPGVPEPVYSTEPPTSGPHLAGDVPSGVQRRPVTRPAQVTLLESGGVMIQYRDLDTSSRRRVEALAARDVVVAPNPDLAADVVATAWRRRLTCDGAGQPEVDALAAFVEAYRGEGPGADPPPS